MPIPFLSQESPNLVIVDWCLIVTQEVLIRTDQEVLRTQSILITSVLINTSCVAIKHQSTITRFGDSWDKKGIGITPDPFGGGAYNLQLISTTPKKVVWFTRLGGHLAKLK